MVRRVLHLLTCWKCITLLCCTLWYLMAFFFYYTYVSIILLKLTFSWNAYFSWDIQKKDLWILVAKSLFRIENVNFEMHFRSMCLWNSVSLFNTKWYFMLLINQYLWIIMQFLKPILHSLCLFKIKYCSSYENLTVLWFSVG